jgi:hypothetical protein
MMIIGIFNRISINYIDMTYIPKWLAIADGVRTGIIGSNTDIFIPELNI